MTTPSRNYEVHEYVTTWGELRLEDHLDEYDVLHVYGGWVSATGTLKLFARSAGRAPVDDYPVRVRHWVQVTS